ncbi:MAG TPA: histidine kinase [Bacteroidia bacterium]|nr:histidine kinase [Bacteroidia bacterium]
MPEKRKISSLLTFIFFFTYSAAVSQHWLPNFKHYTTADGLPSSEVYQIASDSKNILWFATDRGVVSFDGYSFRIFDHKDSLPDNSVIKLYKDSGGRIWFISYTGLLSYYENGKITQYKYNNVISSHLGTTIIVSLYADKKGNLKINSIGGQMSTINAAGEFSSEKMNNDTAAFEITETGALSVSTFYYYGVKKTIPFTRFNILSAKKSFGFLINENIRYHHFSTTKLSNGDLIFYCERFLIRIHPSGLYELKKFENPVLNVFEDNEKKLWIGCYHDGVYVYDSAMTVSNHYLVDLSVSHIYNDFAKGFWFSTLENGIFYLPSKNISTFTIQSGPFHEKVNSVLSLSDSVLFFATSKGVLYKYDDLNHLLAKTDLRKDISPNIESINSLYFSEHEKKLFISTVTSFKSDSFAVFQTRWQGYELITVSSLTKFIPFHDGTLLNSDYSFVYSFNSSGRVISHINTRPFRSTGLFEDSKKRLLSGALDGLYVFKDHNFIPFDTADKFLNSRITDIKEMEDKFLVIGTRSNGIILHDSTSQNIITGNNGLTSDNINRILIKGNDIWVCTNKGLNKITVSDKASLSYSIQNFTVSDGLASDEINDIAIRNNYVYIATNEGISVINAEKASKVIPVIPLYINSIKINEKDTVLVSSYSLSHNQNTIDIFFSTITFRNAGNIVYKYRLLGLDTSWRTTSNHNVQFTSLPHGSYNFQLKGQEQQKTNSDIPIGFSFTISPPFYKLLWFRVFLIIFLTFIISVFINLRVRAIKKKAYRQAALNKKIAELDLKSLRSQMNPHFTFNVLNSIQYYVAKKDTEQALQFITKFSRLIRMILDQSRNPFISLEDEIKMLKLYIELEELRFENKFTCSVGFNNELNLQAILIPGMLIQPFVENAVKHGIQHKKGHARIEIFFKSVDSKLICTITDNGIGRKEAEKLKLSNGDHKSTGTSIVNERIEALNILSGNTLKSTTIDLTDESGSPVGTRVTIEIPFKYVSA